MGTADNSRFLMAITALALVVMLISIIGLVLVVVLRPVTPPPPTAAPVQAQATATPEPRILQEQPPAVPQGTVVLVESHSSQQPDALATAAVTTPIILEPVYGE